MITKEKKSQQVTELAEKFSKSKAVVLTEYKGLTVAEIAELRRLLKEVGVEYKVVKNTLSSIASKGTDAELAKEFFIGPTGIAFSFGDPIAATQKTIEYANKNDKFKIKSGVIEGRLYSVDEITSLSKLPPREVLLGILAGTLQATTAKLGGALSATILQFAYVLEAAKNKKEIRGT